MIGPKKSVLVVEDDESMLEYCETMLGMDGYDVTAVSSGKEALAHLGLRSFDLVLTDHVMIAHSGQSVAQVAKKVQPRAALIVMSGMPTMESALMAYLAGAAQYLAKPFNLDQLRGALSACLG